VPSPRDAAKALYCPKAVPGDLVDFFEAYDALRHFGPSKYQVVCDLMEPSSPERLCRLLIAAGEV